MFFLFLLPFMFFVAVIFYKKQRPQWGKTTLFPNEKVLYTQTKTTVYTIGRDGLRRGMAWAVVRITNKRIFFLYPDKKTISKVLDFSGGKEKNIEEKLQRNTLYLDRMSIGIETDVLGRHNFVGKAVTESGELVQYSFLVYEVDQVKSVLEI